MNNNEETAKKNNNIINMVLKTIIEHTIQRYTIEVINRVIK